MKNAHTYNCVRRERERESARRFNETNLIFPFCIEIIKTKRNNVKKRSNNKTIDYSQQQQQRKQSLNNNKSEIRTRKMIYLFIEKLNGN